MIRATNNPRISVIIPVYNDTNGLETTLISLQKQNIPGSEYEIIVANDGGNPENQELCILFKVKYINIIPRKGSYFARNEAIKIAVGPDLAFVDADITVPPDWLDRGIKSLQVYDYVAGPVQIKKKEDFSTAEWYEYLTAFNIQDYLNRHHFGVTGNLFVKRKIFDELGLFDGMIRSGGDFEFGIRIFESGKFSQAYNENIAVMHPARGYKNYINKIRRISEGRIILTQKYPGRFPEIKPKIYKLIGLILLPPLKKIYIQSYSLKLFFFGWYMNILRGFYTLKYLIKYKIFSG